MASRVESLLLQIIADFKVTGGEGIEKITKTFQMLTNAPAQAMGSIFERAIGGIRDSLISGIISKYKEVEEQTKSLENAMKSLGITFAMPTDAQKDLVKYADLVGIKFDKMAKVFAQTTASTGSVSQSLLKVRNATDLMNKGLGETSLDKTIDLMDKLASGASMTQKEIEKLGGDFAKYNANANYYKDLLIDITTNSKALDAVIAASAVTFSELVLTLAAAYVGYKTLQVTIGTVIQAYQALNAQAEGQNEINETLQAMGTNLDAVTARFIELTGSKMFAKFASDNREAATAWDTTSKSIDLATLRLKAFTLQGVEWVLTTRLVSGFLSDMNAWLEKFNKESLKTLQVDLGGALKPQLFDNEKAAIEHLNKSIVTWAAVSQMSEAQVTAAYHNLTLAFGDQTKAVNILSIAMSDINKMGGQNGAQIVQGITKMFESGSDMSSKELRTILGNINTAKDGMDMYGNQIDALIAKLLEGSKDIETIEFAKKLKEDTTVNLFSVMSAFKHAADYEETITQEMIKSGENLVNAEYKNSEKRKQAFANSAQIFQTKYAQEERLVTLMRSGIELQKAVTGISVSDKFGAVFADIEAKYRKYQSLVKTGHMEQAKEAAAVIEQTTITALSNLKSAYAQTYKLEQTAIEGARELFKAFTGAIDVNAVSGSMKTIDDFNRRSLDSFNRSMQLNKIILDDTKKSGEERLKAATTITQDFMQYRSRMIEATSAYSAASTSAAKSILEIREMEANITETTLLKRLTVYNEELAQVQKLQEIYKADAVKSEELLERKLALTRKIYEVTAAEINKQNAGVMQTGAGMQATQRTMDTFMGDIVGKLMKGGLLSESDKFHIKGMSGSAQANVQAAEKVNMAMREQSFASAGVLTRAAEALKSGGSSFTEFLRGRTREDQEIIQAAMKKTIEASGISKLSTDALKPAVNDPSMQMKDAVGDAVKMIDAFNNSQRTNSELAIKQFGLFQEMDIKNQKTVQGAMDAIDKITAEEKHKEEYESKRDRLLQDFNDQFGISLKEYQSANEFLKGMLASMEKTKADFEEVKKGIEEKPPEGVSLTAEIGDQISKAVFEAMEDLKADINAVRSSPKYADNAARAKREDELLGKFNEQFITGFDTFISKAVGGVKLSEEAQIKAATILKERLLKMSEQFSIGQESVLKQVRAWAKEDSGLSKKEIEQGVGVADLVNRTVATLNLTATEFGDKMNKMGDVAKGNQQFLVDNLIAASKDFSGMLKNISESKGISELSGRTPKPAVSGSDIYMQGAGNTSKREDEFKPFADIAGKIEATNTLLKEIASKVGGVPIVNVTTKDTGAALNAAGKEKLIAIEHRSMPSHRRVGNTTVFDPQE